ncbi:hypothetical protein Pelo_11141 [Pelomyxa schiedti]|nr:hypothetical protein Pelo_11141 [Pelomyxa schiedti]
MSHWALRAALPQVLAALLSFRYQFRQQHIFYDGWGTKRVEIPFRIGKDYGTTPAIHLVAAITNGKLSLTLQKSVTVMIGKNSTNYEVIASPPMVISRGSFLCILAPVN